MNKNFSKLQLLMETRNKHTNLKFIWVKDELVSCKLFGLNTKIQVVTLTCGIVFKKNLPTKYIKPDHEIYNIKRSILSM